MPTVAVGWGRGGFDPPRLNTARLGKVAQVEAYEGDQILNLKLVPNLLMIMMELMVTQVRSLGPLPHQENDWSQIETSFPEN